MAAVVLPLIICCLGTAVQAEDGAPLYLRNQSPFLQIFGLPGPQGGILTPPGKLRASMNFALANHADRATLPDESLVLDGESYFLDTVLRYGLSDRWEIGVDLPYVAHSSGKFDNLIEGWHDLFSLSNSQRDGPSNTLEFDYQRQGSTVSRLDEAGGGIGDVRLSSAYRLRTGADDGPALALRGMVKLPTGNENKLRGSGATDIALSLEATSRRSLAGRPLGLFAQGGALRLGDGQILADQQKTTVPFGAFGLRWQWTENIDLRAQAAIQGSYYRSDLDALGGTTSNLTLGGGIVLRGLGVKLDIAIIEDLISDATPDFGMYLSVRRLAKGSQP
ncbi:MAG: DUF3187 family protein [Gammaproteobacteria bacterium]|nr:DUF3187 family protein [Gammaproteobacteria bacterium]